MEILLIVLGISWVSMLLMVWIAYREVQRYYKKRGWK